MKEIKLTQGKFALVDDEDFEYLNQWKWHAVKITGGIWYASRYEWDRCNKKRIAYSMHRFIMNTPKVMECDHIDHNGLNNQRNNLRNCTHKNNTRNKTSRKNHSSKYLGVSYARAKHKYITKGGKERVSTSKYMFIAHININGKIKYLGSYEHDFDAAKAYNTAALEYYGEYANINIEK